MTRKASLTIGLIVLFLLLFGLITVNKISRKEKIKGQLKTIPAIELVSVDGNSLHIPKNKPVVFILFDPSCEHCKSEARDFENQIGSFSNAVLFWISTATLPEIRKFSIEFNLSEKENMFFIAMQQDQVFSIFGSLFTPHLFIYGKDQRLIKEFKGETSVDIILKYME